MCDVRRTAVRVVLMGLAAGIVAAATAAARAQNTPQDQARRRQEAHAHRETNATREARIARTIEETYSHRWEVAGGGGYLRWHSGQDLKANNEVNWNTTTSYFLDPKLAIVGDVQGSFGNAVAAPGNTYGVSNPQINEYFFLGGAAYRFYRKERMAISAQGLGGTSWGIFSGGAKGYNSGQTGLWDDGLAPAFSVGVNVDFNVYPNLGVRFAPGYYGTMFRASTPSTSATELTTGSRSLQNNAGFNIDIIYRFGKQ